MIKENIVIKYYKSTFGELIVGSFQEKLCLLDWLYRKKRSSVDKRIQTGLKTCFQAGNSIIIEKTIHQFEEYEKAEREKFDIPLLFIGTDFQKNVWNALMKIPYGKTESYMGLAKILNNEKAVRAVANANGANIISVIVPCHRIIGKNGNLVGYAGGLHAKKKILYLENPLRKSQLKLF